MRKLTYKIVEETTNSRTHKFIEFITLELLNGLNNI